MRHGFVSTEGARRAAKQRLCTSEIAELRHRDASKREGRPIVAQGHTVQGTQRIADRKRARRSRD
jgi:hypothetical protein